MAKIVPFKGIRYNPDKINIADVVTKPYDKISVTEQEEYYKQDPHNVVRLILGKQSDTDTENDNRYTRAADFLANWLDGNVLLKEERPVLYLYDQDFEIEGRQLMTRRALVGLGEVVPYSDKIVFPHEKTLSGPKKDRLALSEATKTQFGHIFMLYKDDKNKINGLLDEVSQKEPLYCVKDKNGVFHKLWIADNADLMESVCSEMSDKQLLIADGHHRYETALNMRTQRGDNYKYHLMSFVNIYDPGLIIRPTHRIIKNVSVGVIDNLMGRIEAFFKVDKISAEDFNPADLDGVKFGFYDGSNLYRISLKNKNILKEKMTHGKPDSWYDMPIAVLHELILEGMLGIDKEKLASQTNVNYAETVSVGINMVDKDVHQAAFFVNSTPIEKVCDVAFSGNTMPQKSTDFYPKIHTGLVFNKID